MPDLLSELRRAPHTFNLFQAISVLERAAPERAPVGAGVGSDEAVRLAAHVDLAFAPSDIASLRPSTQPGPAWTLRTAALTLAGAHGPLATPFTELLLEQRSARNPAGLDFLDMFNGRLLGLWHRARAMRHVALQPGVTSPAPLLRTIDTLSGLGIGLGAQGPAGEQGWLRHAALQNAAPRSMATLLALLRDRLGVRFNGEQFVGGWQALAPRERARLGRARSGMSLGARVWDQGAGMALSTPPLTLRQFAELQPGAQKFRLLAWLVAQHLQADFRVTLTLTLAEAPATRLPRRSAADAPMLRPRLGRSAWLSGRARDPKRYRAARFLLPVCTVNLAKRR
ncbi:type VI secretion system baseplate subunit TssG [Massilia sp. YIM B02443]|uniref:type VI secretion system baseplate subunit TssG n=1 Tax=Massilia sp. YIM B02443 TaxID=3050127 RepID=UPI0025B6606D|nr:type VI secretion system baseplate subunit TssG [Massilia sp. YIM B02443]MDN4037636.1 type VI secretion system baseplate subunit TssG [Massilia sp. YIM B02443]